MITETTTDTMENTMLTAKTTMLTAKTINTTKVMVTTKEHVTNETMVQAEGTMGPTDPTDRPTVVATA